MSYRETMEKIVTALRDAEELSRNGAENMRVLLAHYGPQLIDHGADLDRLYDENERLSAIVNLTELAQERDTLKARVSELEKQIAEGGMIY